MKRGLAIPVLAVVLYVFMYLPLLAVVVASTNAATHGVTWKGFTLKWYTGLWENPQILQAGKNTLFLACISTVISTGLGTALGYGMGRHEFRGKPWLDRMMASSIGVPDIVLGAAFLLFYGVMRQWTGLFQLGLGTMILAHVTFQIPFVALVVRARVAGFDRAVEEAASDLGASRLQRLRYVTLPMIWPGMVAGALLAFTLSLDDFVVSFFTSGPGSTTVPILIYSSLKRGLSGEIHALSTVILAISLIATILLIRVQPKRESTF